MNFLDVWCSALLGKDRPRKRIVDENMQLDSYSVLLWGRPLSVVILPPFSFHFSRPLVYVLEDAVHGLCSCSSFSGSCFRPFRRYVSFRNFCVGGQSIHVTFSTRAADMYTDMPIVDRGATATSGIRAQNGYFRSRSCRTRDYARLPHVFLTFQFSRNRFSAFPGPDGTHRRFSNRTEPSRLYWITKSRRGNPNDSWSASYAHTSTSNVQWLANAAKHRVIVPRIEGWHSPYAVFWMRRLYSSTCWC